MDVTAEAAEPQVVFRPGKKRKLYRQRPTDDDATSDVTSAAAETPALDSFANRADEQGPAMAEVLRLRNSRRSRLRGVEFRSEESSRSTPAVVANHEQSLVLRDAAAEGTLSVETVAGMGSRFAPQTGHGGAVVNKHMEEYIESELAKRHLAEASQTSSQRAAAADGRDLLDASSTKATRHEGQPALLGKLQEIDLGEEARARNIAMTERAKRKLRGESVEEENATPPPDQVRLGRDGKPWRPRKRRDSEAIKRDEMVEQFLHENRLDVYEVPAQPGAAAGADEDDGAADDRIAEEFRREFMDALSQRRRRPAAQPSKHGPKKDEEVLKGPKLGGSRNSRAAMRDLLLSKQEQQKKR